MMPTIPPDANATPHALFTAARDTMHVRIDRMFAGLLAVEWMAAIVGALVVSPFSWIGAQSRVHVHVIAAMVLGAVIVSVPIALVLIRPGAALTRHAISAAQMLMSALLIHASGGRIETHFHVFGSLAFLAFYRDWPILVTATIVIAADHALRGVFWPLSVYGVASASSWRWLEHAGWVIFEDVFLIVSCVRGEQEMRKTAARQAELAAQRRDLIVSYNEARSASEAKSAFLANMSHEIRTPMTAILGFADLLHNESLMAAERGSYLQTIRRNSEHLLAIIDDILDLSKIEAGKMTVERIACDPQRIVREVVTLLAPRAEAKQLAIDVEYASKMPVHVQSDPTRLRQILMNVVSNAIKFTECGSVTITVRWITDAVSPHLEFRVKDTGIGVPADKLARLFEPFTQADVSTRRKFGGTGLGLTISKRLVEMLGGELTIESVPGYGSTFRFTVATGSLGGVPIIVDAKHAAATSNLASLETSCADPALSGRVLVAEDGPDNQVLVRAHLKRLGVDVLVVENGQLAVEAASDALLRGEPFDLVLMDMQMPELDGYEATRALRACGYDRPIVALNAHAMAADRGRCIAAGCDDCLTKPISRIDLVAIVRRCVSGTSGESPRVVSEYAGDPDMREIVQDFVRGLPGRVREIREAAERKDTSALRRLVHQLKGAAGGYGFAPITDSAAAVERTLDSGDSRALVDQRLRELANLCLGARASALSPATTIERNG